MSMSLDCAHCQYRQAAGEDPARRLPVQSPPRAWQLPRSCWKLVSLEQQLHAPAGLLLLASLAACPAPQHTVPGPAHGVLPLIDGLTWDTCLTDNAMLKHWHLKHTRNYPWP